MARRLHDGKKIADNKHGDACFTVLPQLLIARARYGLRLWYNFRAKASFTHSPHYQGGVQHEHDERIGSGGSARAVG